MIDKKKIKKISDYLWEIPKDYRQGMNVPARIYATEKMLDEVFRDQSLEQLVNVTHLHGIEGTVMAMPDAHEGYGFPIGGVAAMRISDGVISPGGVGYDINCGMRLLKSEHNTKELKPYLEKLGHEMNRQVPSGVGRGGRLKLNKQDMDKVLKEGVPWLVKQGYGEKEDPQYLESYGVLPNADPDVVSNQAKQRGSDQLGTMGAGNHFVEIDRVSQIFDEEVARAFGLFEDQIVVLIHTGSRGLGHQVCTDFLRVMANAMPKYKITIPDRQLACVPFSSPEGKDYFNAMAAAANFAWGNRQMISWQVRQAWKNILGGEAGNLSTLYDVAHNIAKIEEHEIDGKKMKLIVHRKGATRAFGPGNPELAPEYKKVGQPVLIPGSMGTASYVLVGTEQAMKESFGSSCHGAGRRMSRHAAIRQVQGHELRKELEQMGIIIECASNRGLAEEAPLAYKDVHDVVDVVARAGIARKVVCLKPVAVIKG
ncbi:MAG: RtcB family protein [Deltaproteobacteria bacterium]|mgnify:CR=1 FL=1